MALRVRADFDAPVSVAARDHQWVASPEPGVERVMLDRLGEEVAVATSIVRYAAGSRFAAHRHDRGEEFLVLEGVFADEHADYPAGTYVRNPPGTAHTPRSDVGCTIFVKLRQFAPDDLEPRVIDIEALDAHVADGATKAHLLHRHGLEEVWILDGGIGAVYKFAPTLALHELLVLSGNVVVNGEPMTRLDWVRLPAEQPMGLSFTTAARVFVKTRAIATAA
jgi:anti-sigma factor ChrR (cupin superfamily)